MEILTYDRDHNFKKYFIYWIPKTRILGVKDSKDVVYEKKCTIQDRMELLNVSKTLVEERWSDVFAENGLHIDEICEKELVLTFALQRNITLEKTELSGDFDTFLYSEYARLKKLVAATSTTPTPTPQTATARRKRTISASVEGELKHDRPEMMPLRRRGRRPALKSGPEFVEN